MIKNLKMMINKIEKQILVMKKMKKVIKEKKERLKMILNKYLKMKIKK